MLTARGDVLHAGANGDGQGGTGQQDSGAHAELCPVDLPCPAVDVACGSGHAAVALRSGTALTWGRNGSGQLGRDGDSCIPGAAEGVADVERVYTGGYSTFFLSRGREVAVCGNNDRGQLCLGHTGWVGRPQRVAALCGRRILQLQVGHGHCMLLDPDGSVWVWGQLNGRLADGSDPWSLERGSVPIRLAAPRVRCVAAGDGFSAVVTATEGELLHWGRWRPEQPSPLRLPGDQPAAAVVRSSNCMWARSTDGEFSVCGAGSEGPQFHDYSWSGDLRPLEQAGLASCMPLSGLSSDFALFLEGDGAEEVWYKSVGLPLPTAVLRVPGRELHEEDFETPLCDLGVSAECVVQLLRVPPLPPTAGGAPCPGAALMIYVDASLFGMADHVCVELHPDACVLDLVAAAAEHLGA